MKRFYIVILALIIGHYCNAQNVNGDGNKLSVLLRDYFKTDSTGTVSVSLDAKPEYINASEQTKLFIIDNVLSSRNRKIAFIRYGNKREIWSKNSSNNVILLDSINMNNSDLTRALENKQKLVKHPWFFYFGGQGMFTSEDFTNVSLGLRIGSFLLLDRWDMAVSFGLNGIPEDEEGDLGEINISAGLVSKFYFPMKIMKQRISPYIGGGVDFITDSGGNESINVSGLTGISWALGPGSLDLGVQYSKTSDFTFNIGYTFFPWRK
jgi:hypothetical protein